MQRDQSLDRIRNRSRAADIVVIGGGATGIGVAMIVPKTVDGRVLFIIPWHDHAVVGTTDAPIDDLSLEPTAQSDEIEFLLKTTAEYLDRPPQRADVLTVFT